MKTLIWVLRGLISALFIVSALGKLFPSDVAIFVFEKQIVDLGITNWCFAPILARGIVAFELFLGISLLQNHYLKSFIIPVTVLMLLAFIVHLTLVIIHTGNTGDCGCFGQLLAASPLEAIIKNVISIAILVFIFIKTRWRKREEENILNPAAILVVVYLFVFLINAPRCICAQPGTETVVMDTVAVQDTTVNDTTVTGDTAKQKPGKDTATAPPKKQRPKVRSVFTKYTTFSGRKVDLNAGKKIVCLFSLDCEHCMATCKVLHKMLKEKPGAAGIYVLAFGTEDAVEPFFKEGGGKFPYTILPPEEFFPLLDKANAPPRVVVMDNGNILCDYVNFESLNRKEIVKLLEN